MLMQHAALHPQPHSGNPLGSRARIDSTSRKRDLGDVRVGVPGKLFHRPIKLLMRSIPRLTNP
eukprot:582067-Amphidinium_carterae.1